MKTPDIFGITGRKNSGKTTLVCKLIPELKARGLTVATIKHTHHDIEFDTPGKDSYKHKSAGASKVLIASKKRLAIFEEYQLQESEAEDSEPELKELLNYFNDLDLVLIEGFKQAKHPKIQVQRAENQTNVTLGDAHNIIAIASDNMSDIANENNLPVIDINDISSIADFIIEHKSQLLD